MSIDGFLTTLKHTPESVEFSDTMATIEEHYVFEPTRFHNGDLTNEPEQNQGSCKLLAFARLNNLSQPETLACFGQYYRKDVLEHPAGTDHQNIRNFMSQGWDGVRFEGQPLTPKGK
ncbi:HopJ type III effector protein [Aestuariicella hydrocarbonica]|uniref:HopJ type III effector protein n=1 Tax=Pseudomaricurvus hydrocarbonicus TaxID=1470433 RepID=A0A9E5JUC7_9GAMM|nr:HopJ type III effector protein [Aestuariicella hydrocarbonica]NHO65050.1 HopJ type III effector protein [Aestuariicella hydrocarbonica]